MNEEREEGEIGDEVRDEGRDGEEGVLEDESGGDVLVIGSEVDSDSSSERLAVEDDGSLSKHRVVRYEVEGRLSIDLDSLLGWGSLGESVTTVGEHENVEIHLGIEN